MTIECRCIDNIVERGAAPGTFAPRFSDADHRTEEGREKSSDDDRNPEKRTQAGETEHRADDDTHGRDDEAEQ